LKQPLSETTYAAMTPEQREQYATGLAGTQKGGPEREPCPCNVEPKSKEIWYAGEKLVWDGDIYADKDLDELQAHLDCHKHWGRKAAVIHSGCCHWLYLPERYLRDVGGGPSAEGFPSTREFDACLRRGADMLRR